jgi:hypothetical protein
MLQVLAHAMFFKSLISRRCEFLAEQSEFIGNTYKNYTFIVVVTSLHKCLLKWSRLVLVDVLKHFSFGSSNSICIAIVLPRRTSAADEL